MRTDDLARQWLGAVTGKIDGAIAQMTKSIDAYETDLTTSVKAMASNMVSGETP